MKKKGKGADTESKATPKQEYIEKRDRRILELRFDEGVHDAWRIAERCVREGVLDTTDESLESATRLVRGVIAKARKHVDSERVLDSATDVAQNDIDVMERELTELRRELARQQMIADGEPVDMCVFSRLPLEECDQPACLSGGLHRIFRAPRIVMSIVDTPQGPMKSYRNLWPAGARQKASKDAAILVTQISKLEVVLNDKRHVAALAAKAVAQTGNGDVKAPFTVVVSGKSMNELIASNADTEARPN